MKLSIAIEGIFSRERTVIVMGIGDTHTGSIGVVRCHYYGHVVRANICLKFFLVINICKGLKFFRGNIPLYGFPVIAERAKDNLVTHTQDGYQGLQNSAKAVDTNIRFLNIRIFLTDLDRNFLICFLLGDCQQIPETPHPYRA